MWPWLLALVFLVISARYPKLGIAIRAFFIICAVLVIIILAKTGFVGELLGILISIPVDFIKAAFGLVVALLGSK